MTTNDLAVAAEQAGNRFEFIGRIGWLAKGVVYTLIGVLFVGIAFGAPRTEANQAGAIETIARTRLGSVLLAAIGAGLFLYVIWRVLTVVMPGDWTGRALLDRIGFAISAVIYTSLLVTIADFIISGSRDADSREDRMVEGSVKAVLAMPAGRLLVFFAGGVFIAVGIAFIQKGHTRSFRSQISGDSGLEGELIDRLGTIGWTARGVSMMLIGFFLARAAWSFDPDEAAGLDDSIRQIAGNPIGAVMAGLVGFGFICYGIFAAISARHRDLKGPENE